MPWNPTLDPGGRTSPRRVDLVALRLDDASIVELTPAARGSVPSLCTQTTLVAAPVNARRPVAGASTALAGGSTACDAFEQAAAVARTAASATSQSRVDNLMALTLAYRFAAFRLSQSAMIALDASFQLPASGYQHEL